MNTKILPFIVACATIATFNISCDSKSTSDAVQSTVASAIPDGLISATAPENAVSVVEARAAAKPGAAIVLRGKVGGKMTPISDTAAILVLADENAIASCDQNPDDLCETPWDYCCEEASKIAASTATIQVMGDDGKLLRSTLRGIGDLKELSHLVVSGTVDAASTAEALIINADKIHVEKP
ncbi:MAG: hypothetical protein ACI9R3_005916 [Verrucomicrobiales bacterium]|jgi:hypothetical protein